MKHTPKACPSELKFERSKALRLRVIAVLIFGGTILLISNLADPKVVRSAALTNLRPGGDENQPLLHPEKSSTHPSVANSLPASSDPKNELTGRAEATPTPTPAPTPIPCPTPTSDTASQTVRLYYFREATKIVTILNAVANQPGLNSDLRCLLVSNPSENEIILYGSQEKRGHARQIIATLDLPRPGITMEMWGIQISSRNPKEMAGVMPKVRNEIDRTQLAVRRTYDEMQRLTRLWIQERDLDSDFRKHLETDLFYWSALDANRPLSLADILLRMIAARDPSQAAKDIAVGLNNWLQRPEYSGYAQAVRAQGRQPFERFFNTRGLYYEHGQWVGYAVMQNALQARLAVLDFGLHYGSLVHDPRRFSPYYLQQSAEVLNTRLQDATNALNLDMQDLFVQPTLLRIQEVVKKSPEVEYAQVGKTSVSSLSGTSTEVSSHSVNAFSEVPPLRLSDLLKKADELSKSTGTFVPHPAENLVGAMPLAQVIGLIAAFGEERAVWRELQSGISLTITPNVLRNMDSAELDINLKIGDPKAGTQELGVRPLSRVSQHDLKTKVYVNALDFFDLSAFASQSTLSGGRGYVPIIGPIWQGLFGEIPVAGKLFSWKRGPQTVYTESLVLTNSFVTPTVMGIALLYPTELYDPDTGQPINYNRATFEQQSRELEEYRKLLRLDGRRRANE